MKQVSKNREKRLPKTSSPIANKRKGLEKKKNFIKKIWHPQYGTSKLEEDFAHDFLDALGIEYQYQFEAKDIGRFYDFFIPKSRALIEIDGDYFHANPKLYEDKDLNYMQKRSRVVDELKNKWAYMHGIPLIRIWEEDIRKHPKEVMERLKKEFYVEDCKNLLNEKKNNRHNKKKL